MLDTTAGVVRNAISWFRRFMCRRGLILSGTIWKAWSTPSAHPSFPFVQIPDTPVRQSLVETVPDGPAVDIPARNAEQGMDARPVVLDG